MSDSDRWLLIAGLAIITAALKAFGPIVLGGKTLPPAASRVIGTLAAPLLTALVVTAAFTQGQRVTASAATAGVAVAGLLLWRKRVGPIGAAIVAMIVTAGLRAAF